MNRQTFFVLLLVAGILLTISEVEGKLGHFSSVRKLLRKKRGRFLLTKKNCTKFFTRFFFYLSYKMNRLKWTIIWKKTRTKLLIYFFLILLQNKPVKMNNKYFHIWTSTYLLACNWYKLLCKKAMCCYSYPILYFLNIVE